MAVMDQYYRAYREYMQAVSSLRSHEDYIDALRKADCGADSHDGNVQRREIDMDWVEAIEAALPSIDLAIRENRRFITQEDEIVPIEKSRKITNESVRHLAQHTNMIAKVEGDSVTPESILNIFREESFAIYENRFLRTLLDRVTLFVEKRYAALQGHTDTYLADLQMERDVHVNQENVHFRLDYRVDYRERDSFDIHDDVSTLSGFERVVRIRRILSDFSASPLMRELQKCERVRPPITRTNVLLKDPSFRQTLELWTFIESYQKDGYRIVASSARSPMGPTVQQGLYESMGFLRFALRLKLSPALQEMLQTNYETEQQRRIAEAERLENERKKQEELRLQSAVEQERRQQEEKREVLVAAHQAELAEKDAAHHEELRQQEAAFAADIAWQKKEFEESARQQQVAHEAEMAARQAAYEADITRQKDAFTSEFTAQKSEFEAKLSAQKTEFETELSAQRTDFDSRISAVQQQMEQSLQAKDAAYAAAAEQEKELHEAQLSRLQEQHHAELARLTQAHDAAASQLLMQLESAQSRANTAEAEAKRLKTALRMAEQRLAQEQTTAETLRRNLQRTTARLQQRLDNAESKYRSKLEKQERRSQRKIAKLEKKLAKALAKCPYEEVLAAGEDERETVFS